MKLLYFAWVREKIGLSHEDVDLPSTVSTIDDLISWLETRGPEYSKAFEAKQTINAAIDQTHVSHDTSIVGANEIAFFPPVTGG